ncbi:MFS transporter [Gangjinia marincola]|uniref:MFS transporter n=1 Tax=Gangjinia marincola TaxID=578463 RepID=A0ABP3XSM5_9FLAO
MQLLAKGAKKLTNAWAFYDWSVSVYNLTISSAIFPIYYGALFRIEEIEKVTVFGGEVARAPLISYVTAFAFVLISLITPLVAGIADYTGKKKLFMHLFNFLGAFSCIGLYWFSLDDIYISLLCYLMALVGYWCSFAIYNSYLPDIAFAEQHDRLSSRGYSLGYIGSVILLLFNLGMVMYPETFGLAEGGTGSMQAMRISFLSVGIWWLAFSQYTLYYLPMGRKRESNAKNFLINGFLELKKVKSLIAQNAVLKSYLIAFYVYSMAVQTVMLVATYFGEEEVKWGGDEARQTGLITSILLIQLVAVIGATLTWKAAQKFGNIKTLIGINMIWVVICVVGYFVTLPIHFYITAAAVGFVMGGIQSLSRSTYSKFLPDTIDTTSFFSFYDVAEKIGIIIGMFIYGFIAQVTGSMRNSIIFLAVFFFVGMVLLRRVPKEAP